MKVGPKYKIAKRLGAAVFEKTQSQKFILRAEKKGYSSTGVHGKTNFGIQVLDKQKVRYTYGISATQLSNYVKSIVRSKVKQPEAKLFELLERRLDNVVLRSGLATTRFQARQIVTHGHMKVNGKKTTVPSYQVKKGDIITVKESNRTKPLFSTFKDKEKDINPPSWISVDNKSYSVTVLAEPQYKPTELAFNLGSVVQFYKR